jgi:hypothetical protein
MPSFMPRYTQVALGYGGLNIRRLVTDKVTDLEAIKDEFSHTTIFTYIVPVRRIIKVSDPGRHLNETLKQIELDAETIQLLASTMVATPEMEDIIIEVSL